MSSCGRITSCESIQHEESDGSESDASTSDSSHFEENNALEQGTAEIQEIDIAPHHLHDAMKGTLALSIPHFNNHRDMVPLPTISLKYDGIFTKQKHKEEGFENKIDDNLNSLQLIDLYNDIKSAFDPDLKLNVNWINYDDEDDKCSFTEEQLHEEIISFLPVPNYDDLSEYHYTLKTLHFEHIYKEAPRTKNIHFINIKKDNFMKRDDKLQQFYHEAVDKFIQNNNQSKKIIVDPDQYKEHKIFKNAIRDFLKQNDEYCANPIIKNYAFDDVIDVVCIEPCHIDMNHHSALLNEKGLIAKMDIASYTVIGQYFGNEILSKVEDKRGTAIDSFEIYDGIFHETSAQMIHGRYSFDVTIEATDYNFSYVVDPLPLQVESDRDLEIVRFAAPNMCKLIYINDCRKEIDKVEMTENDERFHNVEYVQCNINGWGQIYLISIKNIKKGEQLFGYYKNELIKQIELEKEYAAMVEHNSKIKERLPLLKTLFN